MECYNYKAMKKSNIGLYKKEINYDILLLVKKKYMLINVLKKWIK